MPRIGKCSNFGLCGKADAREAISLIEGVAFECPECGRALTAASGSGSGSGGTGLGTKKIGIIGGAVAALLAGVYFVLPKDPAGLGDPNAIVEPPSGGGGVVAPTGDPGLAPPGPGPVDAQVPLQSGGWGYDEIQPMTLCQTGGVTGVSFGLGGSG